MAYDQTYSNHEAKGRVKSMFLPFIPKSGKVVTLAGTHLEFEIMLAKRGNSVTTLENEEKVYEEQKEICDKIPFLNNQFISAEEYMMKKWNQKAEFFYHDFCAPLTDRIFNVLVKSNAPYVGLTLMKAREKHFIPLRNTFLGKYKNPAIARNMWYIHMFTTAGFEIEDRIDYIGDRGASMVSFLLKKQ